MTNHEQMRSDSLTLFLSYACNTSLGQQIRARKIRRTAKLLSKRTRDIDFKTALIAIHTDDRDFKVIEAVGSAVTNYLRGSNYE